MNSNPFSNSKSVIWEMMKHVCARKIPDHRRFGHLGPVQAFWNALHPRLWLCYSGIMTQCCFWLLVFYETTAPQLAEKIQESQNNAAQSSPPPEGLTGNTSRSWTITVWRSLPRVEKEKIFLKKPLILEKIICWETVGEAGAHSQSLTWRTSYQEDNRCAFQLESLQSLSSLTLKQTNKQTNRNSFSENTALKHKLGPRDSITSHRKTGFWGWNLLLIAIWILQTHWIRKQNSPEGFFFFFFQSKQPSSRNLDVCYFCCYLRREKEPCVGSGTQEVGSEAAGNVIGEYLKILAFVDKTWLEGGKLWIC